jgi:hypothetical protein
VQWHDVRVDVEDRAAFDLLRLMVQRARHHITAPCQIRITVLGSADRGYRLLDAGDLYASVETPEAVLDEVSMRVYRRAMELASLKGWLRVHGAVAGFGERRVAVIGAAAAGKSTLSVGLLCEGANVEVDESFLARNGQVVGVARRLHVKPGTVSVVPAASWLAEAPALGPLPVRVVDPTEHGFAWELPIGPVQDLIVLRRTDGPSRLEPILPTLVVQEVLDQVFPVLESRRDMVRQASLLAASARCHELHAGPDGLAPRLVRILVTSPALT